MEFLSQMFCLGVLVLGFYVICLFAETIRRLGFIRLIMYCCGVVVFAYLAFTVGFVQHEDLRATIISLKTKEVLARHPGVGKDCSTALEPRVHEPQREDESDGAYKVRYSQEQVYYTTQVHRAGLCELLKDELKQMEDLQPVDYNRQIGRGCIDFFNMTIRVILTIDEALEPVDNAFAKLGGMFGNYALKVATWIVRVMLFCLFCVAWRMLNWARGGSSNVSTESVARDLIKEFETRGVLSRVNPNWKWMIENVPEILESKGVDDLILGVTNLAVTKPHLIQQSAMVRAQVQNGKRELIRAASGFNRKSASNQMAALPSPQQ